MSLKMIVETYVAYPKTMLAVTLKTMFGALSSWMFLENEEINNLFRCKSRQKAANSPKMERKTV